MYALGLICVIGSIEGIIESGVAGFGLGIWGLGLGFGVCGLGCGVWGFGFEIWGLLGFGVWSCGSALAPQMP